MTTKYVDISLTQAETFLIEHKLPRNQFGAEYMVKVGMGLSVRRKSTHDRHNSRYRVN